MAEDEEQRPNRSKASRRDAARGKPQDSPLIEGEANEVTGEPETVPERPFDAASPLGTPTFPPGDPLAADDAFATRASDDFAPTTSNVFANETAFATPEDASQTGSAGPATDWARAQPEAERSSSLPAIFAGVAAILAAAIVYLFYALSNAGPDLSPDVAALKTQLAALQARPSVDAVAMTKRLDGADASLASLKSSVAALDKKVDGLGTLPAASAAPVVDLSPRIASLDSQVSDLGRNLGDLRTTVANLPKPDDLGPLNSKIGDVDQRLTALVGTVNAIPRIDLGPLTSKLDDVDARLKPVESEVNAAKSAQRVAERQAAPLAVTAQAILDAITTDQPFPRELKALQALGADPAKLAPLQSVAESGAPSLGDLQADLARLRDRMVAEGAPPVTGSYIDRLVAGAGTLVHVRPLGSVVGDTPSAIVARMNSDIAADDLKAARDEWQKLPEASRSASKSLAERLTLRLDAETAAKSIASTAIEAMAAPKG